MQNYKRKKKPMPPVKKKKLNKQENLTDLLDLSMELHGLHMRDNQASKNFTLLTWLIFGLGCLIYSWLT